MKRTIYILLLLVLLGVSQAYAARVNNVELNYQDGNTVAKIFVEGKVRFVHQTEEAKDGKPFRVIVDVLSATHQLGQKNYSQLPDCLIRAIRSSQYSVSPEQIVRVVFDLKESTIYRVDSDNESISVFFQDKKTVPFAAWSSSKEAAPAKEAPAVKKIQEPVTVVKTDTRVTAVPSVKAAPKKETPAPATVINKEQPTAPTAAKTETKKQVVAAKEEVKPAAQPAFAQKAPENKPAAKPEVKPETKPKSADAKVETLKKVETVKQQPPVLASAEPEKNDKPQQFTAVPKTRDSKLSRNNTETVEKTKTQPQPEQTPKAPPAKTKSENKATSDNSKSETKPAVKEKEPEQESKSKTTSRFRRSPTSPTKIKGTLVAEFPKRLVVKYKARSYRDPFATLIDDTRSYQGPVEQRMPNVEGLKLVGIIEASGDSNRALFEDKEGYSYILKSGDKVKKGYVLRVESDRVYFQIFEYGWSRTVALKIEEY